MTGRIPPHDLDAELAILSAVFADPNALDRLVSILQAEHFYAPAHRRIYEAFLALTQESKPIDTTTVGVWLRSRNLLADIGGVPYIGKIFDTIPVVANIEAYASVVREKWRLRQLITTCQGIAAEAYGDVGEAKAWLDKVEGRVFAITHDGENEARLCNPAEGFRRALTSMASKAGYTTGFSTLNERLGGLRPGELTIVAARPGMGKTSFVGSLGFRVSTTPHDEGGEAFDIGAAIVSCEMSAEALSLRMICTEARVSATKIRKSTLDADDMGSLTSATSWFEHAPIWLYDCTAPSVLEIKALVRRLKAECERRGDGEGRRCKLGVVAVDYLQLMRGDGKHENRTGEVSQIARGLKNLAKECGVHVIALSQLSRQIEQRPNKRPVMSDLRESGEIEAAADMVLGLYRDDYYNPQSQDAGTCEVIVLKNRNGEAAGTIRMAFNAPCTRFDDLERNA